MENEFDQHKKDNPNYVLTIPGTDLKENNYLKIEIDVYDIKTVAKFLEVDSEEEMDNRIKHLFKFLHKDHDELAVDRVIDYLVGKGKKRRTIEKISKKIYDELNPKDQVKNKWTNVGVQLFKLDNYLDNVKAFHTKQPFFVDDSDIFWLWNKEKSRYEITKETDIMNAIEEELYLFGETITHGIKNNYLEAFRRIGRKNIPKDAPNKWVQFKNKAFSIRSEKEYEVKPNYFFTNPIPWELGKSSETPTMDKLFREWVGEKYVKTLYEIIAYCCYRDYPIQVLFCLYGIGRNGKSCFLKLLGKFIGKKNLCSTDLDLLVGFNASRFEAFKLYKKLGCIMGETNFGVLSTSSMLKKLTGGDLIGFEKKGKDPFDDYSYAKLIIASNSLPTSEDTSEGFYRRWVIIDFPNQFPEGKDILKTIPKEEYNNLARKCCEILPSIIDKGEFCNQGNIKERKQKYIMASNPLNVFLNERCFESVSSYLRYSELYTKYVQYLKETNKRIVSKREFSKYLDIEGLEVRRTTKDNTSDRYIEGIDWIENKISIENFN